MNNHFDFVPATLGRKRSTFNYDRPIATTGYLGFLYPLGKPIPFQPGTTIDLNSIACEVRSLPLVAPLSDELYMDIFAFAVPNRIVWEHWKQHIGSHDDVLFTSSTQYTRPYIMYHDKAMTNTDVKYKNWYYNQSLAGNMELPFSFDSTNYGRKIDALPFRGYNFIWNEFFMPEQIANPILFSKGDRGNAGENIACAFTSMTLGGTTVKLPIPGQVTGSSSDTIVDGGAVLPVYRMHKTLYTSCLPNPSLEAVNIFANVTGFPRTTTLDDGNVVVRGENFEVAGDKLSDTGALDWSTVNLSVSAYRESLMLDNYYNALNRSGSRYDEIMYNIFGIRTGESLVDIPNLIVHKRFTIFRNQVVASAESVNSSGDTVSAIGTQKGYIDTVIRDSLCRYTATEHGYLHLMYCVRPAHIRMANGIEPSWRKLDKMDLYYPQFDGMGDVARYRDEIVVNWQVQDSVDHDVVFGYQEYGAEYKWQRASATGWLNPYSPNPIVGYTLAEKLHFSDAYLKGDLYSYCSCLNEFNTFAGCLTITDPTLAPHFIFDFRLNGTITEPMPVYNIPGVGVAL